jgi:Peptidase family M23
LSSRSTWTATSGYFHSWKDQNKVVPKQKVSAGTQLGQPGNSGGSSEPHLHFGSVSLHPTGRGAICPVAFSNLKTLDGQPVTVIPGSGR